MATMSCPACGTQIPKSATRCPNCTSRIVTVTEGAGTLGAAAYGVFVGVILGGIVGYFLGSAMWGAIICAILFGLLTYKFGVKNKVAR